jgi:hypothetical protein
MGYFKAVMALLLSASLMTATAPVFAAPTPAAQPPQPTVLEAACGPNGNQQSCVYLSAWHWFRKARIVIDPAIKTIEFSSTVWTLAMVAQWIGGEAPAVTYTLTISRAGIQAGTLLLLTGAAAIVVGTLVSAGGFLLAMVRPAGGPGDDRPPTCEEIIAPYNSPDGLEKLLQLPKEQFEFVIRCLPKDSPIGKFVIDGAEHGRQLEEQLRLH